jgi:hypothetical protein
VNTAPELAFAGTGRFELLRPLGEGGMGAVYEVRDREHDARVALKTLKATAPESLLYLKKEFRALQDLRHPNLVRLGELFEDEGRWFFTMELIDGVDFLSWVRPGGDARALPTGESETGSLAALDAAYVDRSPPRLGPSPALDEARLRDALAQLARGLAALHAAGKVHRDVKPSNVLVSSAGRVVLVDFGLSIDVASGGAGELRAVGTAAFMAPEQAARETPTAAADWYSFGVLLYAALTGELPFRGARLARQRANEPPPKVRSRAPAAPENLSALCDELLALDPIARPSDREVLRRMGVDGEPRAFGDGARFVGRGGELAALEAAFGDSRGRAVTALVIGDSGLGKSMLARELITGLRLRDPRCVIFAGRCYERESVPYNALDGIVDAVSEFLAALDDATVGRLLPTHAGALARVFPVLGPALRRTSTPAEPLLSVSAQELRTQAFTALRELLAAIAEARPLLLYIDDLHWADADSLALLAELLAAATAPRLFLLATLRAPSAEVAHQLDRLPDARRLHLAPLPAGDAQRLALGLIGGVGDAHLAEVIAREAGGHPLFLVELAHQVSRDGGAGVGGVRLDGALWARVQHLEPAARRLLEVLAIAGSPLSVAAAARAAALLPAAYADQATALAIERFARTNDAHGGERVEPYHDRVREAVLANLSADVQRDCNLRLAYALEADGSTDDAQLARHFADGGEPARALGYMTRAAHAASSALALEEAARLYRRALELHALAPGDEAAREVLELATADAFSAAGHGKQASALWLGIAARAGGRIDLQRRAAEELLSHGLLEEGYAVLDRVLAALGLSRPRSTLSAIARVAMSRVRVALFGDQLQARVPSERELERVDLIGGITLAQWTMDPLIGAALQADHLRLALRSGDRARAAYAYALEAIVSASDGNPAQARTQRWTELSQSHADTIDRRMLNTGYESLFSGIALLEGRWIEAHAVAEPTVESLARAPLGKSWVRDFTRLIGLMTWFWRGRPGELLARSPGLIRDAEEHGNVNMWSWLQALEIWALSHVGHGDEARAHFAAFHARLPSRGFSLQRWYVEHSRVVTLLCERRGEEAWHTMRAVRRRTRFAMVGQAQRAWSTWLRANAALARAIENPASRGAMLASARRLALELDGERSGWVDAAAACVRAGVTSFEGTARDTLPKLEAAEALLAAHDVDAQLAAVRVVRGGILGGTRGRALVEQGRAFEEAQKLAPAARWMILPGAWCEAGR